MTPGPAWAGEACPPYLLALADLDREDGSFHGPDVPGVFHLGFERARLMDRLRALGLVDVAGRTAHTVHKTGPGGDTREYPIFLISGRRTDAA